MPLPRINLHPSDVRPRTIFDCLGSVNSAFVCYTGIETFIICDKGGKYNYRVFAYALKDDNEDCLFDENGECLLLPEYTLYLSENKEGAVLSFTEAVARSCLMAESVKAEKIVPPVTHFDVKLRIWLKEEINKNKGEDESEEDFIENAILQACKKNVIYKNFLKTQL